MPEYPKRGNHFAHRFTRMLTKTAVAQELGPQVCFLLTVIAHQEDAKRYTGAVTFWNEQLMPLVGTAKWRTLDRFRKVAVEAGWLYYENRGKRKPGVYWVLIPAWAEPLTDAPVDEGISPQMDHKGGDKGGYNGGHKGGDNDGHKRGHSSTLTLSLPLTQEESSIEDSCPEASGDAAEPPAEPEQPVMVMPCTNLGDKPREWPVVPSKVAEWQEAFPGVDVLQELRKARQWLRDNPTKLKTYGGMSRYLGSWLARAQDQSRGHPPTAGGMRRAPIDKMAGAKALLAKRRAEEQRRIEG